jgi:hypothetical protein
MKGTSFLLAAVFLLAIVLLFYYPAHAAPIQDPVHPDNGQPEGVSGVQKLFSGKGGIFIALALLWLLMSGIMAIRDIIITKETHGPGLGQSK